MSGLTSASAWQVGGAAAPPSSTLNWLAAKPKSATVSPTPGTMPPVWVPGVNTLDVSRCSFFTSSGQQVKPSQGSASTLSGSTTTVVLPDGTRKTLVIGSVGDRYALYDANLKRALITTVPSNTGANWLGKVGAFAQQAVSTPGMKSLLSQVRTDAVKKPTEITSITQLQKPYSVTATKGLDSLERHVEMGPDSQGVWWAAVPKSASTPTQFKFIKLGTDQKQSTARLQTLLNDKQSSQIPFVLNDLNRVVPNSYGRAQAVPVAKNQTYDEWRDQLIKQVAGNLPPVAKELVGLFAGAGLEIGGKLVFTTVEIGDLLSALNKRLTKSDAAWSSFVNSNFGGSDAGSKAMRTLLKDRPTGGATDAKYIGAVVLAAAKKAGVWGMREGSANQAAEAIGKTLVGMVKSELKELDPKTHTHDNMGAYIGTALGKLATFWIPVGKVAVGEAKAIASGVRISGALAAEVGAASLARSQKVLKAAGDRLSQLKTLGTRLTPKQTAHQTQLLTQSKAAASAAATEDTAAFQKAVGELEQTLKEKPAGDATTKPATTPPNEKRPTVPPSATSSLAPLGDALKIRVFANNSTSLGNAKLFETLIDKFDGQKISAIRNVGVASTLLDESSLATRSLSYQNAGVGNLAAKSPFATAMGLEKHDLHTAFGGASKLGEVNANSGAFRLGSNDSWATRGLLPGQGKFSTNPFWRADAVSDFSVADGAMTKLESSTFNITAGQFDKQIVAPLSTSGFIPKGSPLATRLERLEAQLTSRDALQARANRADPSKVSGLLGELNAANASIEVSLKQVTKLATQARGELLLESLGNPKTTYRLTTEHAATARYMESVRGDTEAVFSAAKYKKILAEVKAEAGDEVVTGLKWHRTLVKTYAANADFVKAMENGNPAMKAAWDAYKLKYGI
jgi:hypothetical protein